MSPLSKLSISLSSKSSAEIGSGPLWIQEMQDIIWSQMVEEIQQGVVREGWEPEKVTNVSQQPEQEGEEQEPRSQEDDDNSYEMSVISDITMHTSFAQDISWSQIPEDTKEKVMKEAWERLFSISQPRELEVDEQKPEEESAEDDFDDMSVVSDITMFTNYSADTAWSQMPEKIKQKVMKEAWGRVFGISESNKRESEGKDDEPQDESDSVDYDDVSDISDITMHTSGADCGCNGVAPLATGDDDSEQDAPHGPSTLEGLDPTFPSTVSAPLSNELSSSLRHSASRSPKELNVRFGNVKVRYYERILDVNPSVTSGVALGIGWRFRRGDTVSVDEWEKIKGNCRRSDEFLLPRHVRESMLKRLGYTQKDFAIATRIILKAKHRRKVTIQNLKSQHFEETVEKAVHRLRGLLTSFGKKRGPS